MRVLESLAAAVLIILVLPLIIVGSVGVIAAGQWPLFRTVSCCRTPTGGQLVEFNTRSGCFERFLRGSSSSHLPSLFKVLAGRSRLRDVAFAKDHRYQD
jgi:hypothetical protein